MARTYGTDTPPSAPIFLVLRRMRTPLIALILILAATVLGLTLIPGRDGAGNPDRMGFFEAFYFMSYTASTIGFGELPHPFTDAQRMWVTLSIYLTVIGWAYAIGSLLSLLQDRAFRTALNRQRFIRKVARMREPFLLVAGYGYAGELLGRSWDSLGRSFVAIDVLDERIDSLDVVSYNGDVPGLVADASDPDRLEEAGLHSPFCEAVVALTNDDEANLAITMSAALLRPDLPVIARTISPAVEDRMHAFGTPVVINPFDRFGDHLRLALRSPAAFQLLTWMEAGPGSEQPPRGRPPTDGRWIICGYGRLGREIVADLGAEGLSLTVLDSQVDLRTALADTGHDLIEGDASEPEVLARADIEGAVGLIAGTDDDTTNLSLIAAARRRNPDLFTAARQNQPTNRALFDAMHLDVVLVPSQAVAREAYARLVTPLLWRFLEEVSRQGDDEAGFLLGRLSQRCGQQMKDLWKVQLTPAEAPALTRWLDAGQVTLADLLRDPEERSEVLPVVPLLLLRDGAATLAPDDDARLAVGDEILFAGPAVARRGLLATMKGNSAAAYVFTGVREPEAWIWRALGLPAFRRRGTPEAQTQNSAQTPTQTPESPDQDRASSP